MGAFIYPLTDWGFKRIFGDKELMMDFLNSLLEGERVITDLEYLNTEQIPEDYDGRRTVYDLYCKTDTGEYIIVEMQNREQTFFKDRALYYMSQSVVKQAQKGKGWRFNLTAVYGIYFVNFLLDKNELGEHFCKDIAMIDKHTGKVFNNKFRQIYIELPRFMKSEADCNNFLEYWIYNLVNMNKLKEISFKDRKAIFDRLEQIASQANLTEEERARLDEDWKNYNDYFNTVDFAKDEGRAEGELKKQHEIAQKMKAKGQPSDFIADITGLTIEEIEKL
jgi:predicted transposase/invertase (TIGR01784 family)